MGKAEVFLVIAVIFGGLSVYLLFFTFMNTKNDKEFLAWSTGRQRQISSSKLLESLRQLAGQFTLKYAFKIKNLQMRSDLEKKIKLAGMAKEVTVDEMIGIQLLCGVFFPCLIFMFDFALELGLPVFAFPILMAGGYLMPKFHLNAAYNNRVSAVRIDLPFYIDIMALSTSAGLSLFDAIKEIVEKGQGSVLADEFSKVLTDIAQGRSRMEALKDMTLRLEMQEITSFINMLIDSDESGAPISGVLKDQSEQMRSERFARAEKLGGRAQQLIPVATMLLIVPAIFLIIGAPAILSMMSGG